MKENYFASVEVINALTEMLYQVYNLDWTIPVTDRGSGAAGVHYIDDASVIAEYLEFAKTGNNDVMPQCRGISYIACENFTEEENEVIDEIVDNVNFVDRSEIVGLVVIDEVYDLPYTLYIPYISED